MSRQMKHFADYFMQGMALGGKWAEQWEARQIAKARNDIMKERNAAVDKRENTKLGLYGESVRANAELAKARAYRALNPVAKGGGKSDATANPGLDSLTSRWAARDAEAGRSGALPQARAPQSGGTTNNYYSGSEDGGGDGNAPSPPSEGGYGDDGGGGYTGEQAKGGMVKGYAEGGIVEGMSLSEARSYDTGVGSSSPKKAKPAASPFSGAMAAATTKYKPKDEEKPKTEPDVRPTGPQGSGVGGSYTTADTGPGGVIDTNYRAGGAVKGYAEGGAVTPDLTGGYDPEAIAVEMRRYMQQTQWQPNPPEQSGGIQDMGGSANAATGNTSGSVGGATAAAGGGSEAAVGGTGGVGGSASSDAGVGGSAAAGTGDSGSGEGGGTYRKGGQVRRFQSGGRVMREQAIDTGTSGPGSGYGYRAAPPSRSY